MTRFTGSVSRLMSPGDADGTGGDQKNAPKKAAPVSRLGRGLGALIPAAAPRPSPVQPVAASPSAVSTPVPPVPSAKQSSPVTAEPKLAKSAGSDQVTRDTTQTRNLAPTRDAGKDQQTAGSAVQIYVGSPDASGARAPIPTEASKPIGSDIPPHLNAGASTDPRSTWNTTSDQTVISIPIARIQRNPRQPRERFEDAALRALADSIRQDGLMQPIVVRASKTISASTGVQMYELIAGERRLRAFTLLGRSTIPALVQKVDDKTSAVLALIENIQREDLNPMERAHGLQKLMHEFAFTQQDLASRVGLDRSTVANLLRLNDLDPHTAGALREGSLTTGHAKALLGISDLSIRKSLVARIITEGLSVRELEREVRQAGTANAASSSAGRLPASGRVISAQVADLERRIGAHLGTEILLKTGRKAGSGSITIKFGSHSQFEGLMDRIGFDLEGSDRPGGR